MPCTESARCVETLEAVVVVVLVAGLGLGGRESLMARRCVVVGAMPKVRRDWAICWRMDLINKSTGFLVGWGGKEVCKEKGRGRAWMEGWID